MSATNTDENTPIRIEVDFNHRLTGTDTQCLSDSIGLMTDRALGVLHLLSMQFEDASERLNDALLCGAIDSVIREIEDINSLVKACCEAEHAENTGHKKTG